MKRTLLFTVLLLIVSGITVKAQTEKGKIFLAGSNRLELNIGGEKEKYNGDLVEGSEVSYFDFDFQPRIGYFFFDNFTAGLFMDVDLYTSKDKDEDYGYTTKGMTLIIGPFARYYFHICDKLIPFAEGQVGFGIDNYKYKANSGDEWDEYNEGVFTYRVGGGATYFFNDMVGADLFLGFNHSAYTYKNEDNGEVSRSDHKSKYIYNEFIMQLGIVVLLGK